MMSGGRNRFPFTANQWQELEHQALIFKYMASGMPIPSDLLFTIKRSLDSSISSKLILQPQHVGWNCFQMGFGRKIDPEPGRCRRTDGKKWRCSKEAYPDSKYCERHMHRGRNRSRKPVETNTNTNTSSITTNNTPPISSLTTNKNTNHHILSPLSSTSSSLASDAHHYYNTNSNTSNNSTSVQHPFVYSHSSQSASRTPGMGLVSQDNNNTHFLFESGTYSHSDKDYRNSYGEAMKEDVDEHPFFHESSGTMRNMSNSDTWHLEPLTMSSSLAHQKQQQQHRNCSALQQSGYPYLQLQETSKHPPPTQDHHYYVPLKSEREAENEHEPQKVMHHFFDEWPPKNEDSISTTQLSISMPRSSHDFFMTHTDK